MLAFRNFKMLPGGLRRYRMRRVLYIALFWTAIDIIATTLNFNTHENHTKSIVIRSVLVFIMSSVMGYLFVFTLKNIFREKSPLLNFIAKSLILLFASLVMNFLVHFAEDIFVGHFGMRGSMENFYENVLDGQRLLKRTLYWIILFAITQLYLEINDKYAPGVFMDILFGKYLQPKDENRIIMFIDLKDSTPIAEKLGHSQYFNFIRDFIYQVSVALIEHNGIIYQYVGDEIVVTWKASRRHIKESLGSIIEARRRIQKNSERFRRKYGVVPEFRVGIHTGIVTVGEIGVIKKDLAMSGDTMNTCARIRSACTELNRHFIVSAAFAEQSGLKPFQLENLGVVELKGKAEGIELFALKF